MLIVEGHTCTGREDGTYPMTFVPHCQVHVQCENGAPTNQYARCPDGEMYNPDVQGCSPIQPGMCVIDNHMEQGEVEQ